MTDAGVPPGSAPAWQKGTQLAGSTRGVEGATAAVALDRGAAWAGLQTSDIAKPLRVFAAEVGFDPGRGCPHTLSRTARRTADWRAERVMGTEPSSSRWLGGALRVLRQPGPQVLHLGSQRLDLCGQNVNLGVLGLDDPAQRLHRPHAVQRTHQAGRPGIIPVPRLSGRGSAQRPSKSTATPAWAPCASGEVECDPNGLAAGDLRPLRIRPWRPTVKVDKPARPARAGPG